MFTQVRHVDVTIPAGTPKASPLVTSFQFGTVVMDRVDWLFPQGCNGLVGVQIGAKSVPIIPYDRTQFIVRSGNSAGVALSDMHNTGDWSVIGYNTGAHPHTIHFTFTMHAPEPPLDDRFIVDSVAGILGIGES